ncbi:hypothetical protein CJP74_01290 [Psittacicella melopsittaci]|uniref:Helicase ATP-binding domain-containing protein n=1 Tax=Psittacicella melopsittaci TaxID=2028576 RepID=A0A3A1Y800_9GAMM|nr:helicase C-terminal domain-containing protein [Psittacicella melopsittaci]RIY33651.1 hypothetical protein CJP74_01290 [Psittacicella melopsittaci]
MSLKNYVQSFFILLARLEEDKFKYRPEQVELACAIANLLEGTNSQKQEQIHLSKILAQHFNSPQPDLDQGIALVALMQQGQKAVLHILDSLLKVYQKSLEKANFNQSLQQGLTLSELDPTPIKIQFLQQLAQANYQELSQQVPEKQVEELNLLAYATVLAFFQEDEQSSAQLKKSLSKLNQVYSEDFKASSQQIELGKKLADYLESNASPEVETPDVGDEYFKAASNAFLSPELEQLQQDEKTLVREAPTGTGKSFAYLVPILFANQRVIVSTFMKALQEQLSKELPELIQTIIQLSQKAQKLQLHIQQKFKSLSQSEYQKVKEQVEATKIQLQKDLEFGKVVQDPYAVDLRALEFDWPTEHLTGMRHIVFKGQSNYFCPRALAFLRNDYQDEDSFLSSLYHVKRGKTKQDLVIQATTNKSIINEGHEVAFSGYLIEQLNRWLITQEDAVHKLDFDNLPGKLRVNEEQRSFLFLNRKECSMNNCKYAQKCPYLQVREKVKEAKLVILNHNTLYYQANSEGLNKDCQAIIVDEAHNLPHVLTNSEAIRITPEEMLNVLTDISNELKELPMSNNMYTAPFSDLQDNAWAYFPDYVDSESLAQTEEFIAQARCHLPGIDYLPVAWFLSQEANLAYSKNKQGQVNHFLSSLQQSLAGLAAKDYQLFSKNLSIWCKPEYASLPLSWQRELLLYEQNRQLSTPDGNILANLNVLNVPVESRLVKQIQDWRQQHENSPRAWVNPLQVVVDFKQRYGQAWQMTQALLRGHNQLNLGTSSKVHKESLLDLEFYGEQTSVSASDLVLVADQENKRPNYSFSLLTYPAEHLVEAGRTLGRDLLAPLDQAQEEKRYLAQTKALSYRQDKWQELFAPQLESLKAQVKSEKKRLQALQGYIEQLNACEENFNQEHKKELSNTRARDLLSYLEQARNIFTGEQRINYKGKVLYLLEQPQNAQFVQNWLGKDASQRMSAFVNQYPHLKALGKFFTSQEAELQALTGVSDYRQLKLSLAQLQNWQDKQVTDNLRLALTIVALLQEQALSEHQLGCKFAEQLEQIPCPPEFEAKEITLFNKAHQQLELEHHIEQLQAQVKELNAIRPLDLPQPEKNLTQGQLGLIKSLAQQGLNRAYTGIRQEIEMLKHTIVNLQNTLFYIAENVHEQEVKKNNLNYVNYTSKEYCWAELALHPGHAVAPTPGQLLQRGLESPMDLAIARTWHSSFITKQVNFWQQDEPQATPWELVMQAFTRMRRLYQKIKPMLREQISRLEKDLETPGELTAQEVEQSNALIQKEIRDAEFKLETLNQMYEVLSYFSRYTGYTDSQRQKYAYVMLDVDEQRKQIVFNLKPLESIQAFSNLRSAFAKAKWVLTSATLSIAQDCSRFTQTLGIKYANVDIVASPFRHHQRAYFYMQNNKGENDAAALIYRNKGRCLWLCTSNQRVKYVSKKLQEMLDTMVEKQVMADFEKNRQVPTLAEKEDAVDKARFKVLWQDREVTNNFLIESLKSDPRTVVVATRSFWEGVDIKGDKLSLIIMDKYPNPQLNAYYNTLSKLYAQNSNYYYSQYYNADGYIIFKQGLGRLIRTEDDFGLIMLLDHGKKAYLQQNMPIDYPNYVLDFQGNLGQALNFLDQQEELYHQRKTQVRKNDEELIEE